MSLQYKILILLKRELIAVLEKRRNIDQNDGEDEFTLVSVQI